MLYFLWFWQDILKSLIANIWVKDKNVWLPKLEQVKVLVGDKLKDTHICNTAEEVAIFVKNTSKSSSSITWFHAERLCRNTDASQGIWNEWLLVIVSHCRNKCQLGSKTQPTQTLSYISCATTLIHCDCTHMWVCWSFHNWVTLRYNVDCSTSNYCNFSSLN